MSWRILVVTSTTILVAILTCSVLADTKSLNADSVQYFAQLLGEQLNETSETASSVSQLEKLYKNASNARVIDNIRGADLVNRTAKKISEYLSYRFEAVKNIKRKAEDLYTKLEANSTLVDCNSYNYYNSKNLEIYEPVEENFDLSGNETIAGPNTTYQLELHSLWKRYFRVPVSVDSSAIHVPTNIFECGPSVISNISWTEGLNEAFKENYGNIPSAWQFFASSSGFLRFFPAAKWKIDGVDMYDARLTEWYTGGASTAKNIVVLLDSSGSMTGLRIEIAKKTVNTILKSLQENDRFNVIAFGNASQFVDNCTYFKDKLVQATARNKKRIALALDTLELSGIARFELAFELAFQVFKNHSGLANKESNNAIMVITDGAPRDYKEVFEKYNWEKNGDGYDKKIRVFSYLIGREVTQANADQVAWMACANKGYYYHIATMADVHDYVQDYVRVMARPLVVHNVDHYSWSGVHVNIPAARPHLTVSISMPVYDLRPEMRNHGRLLGVAGVDVRIQEILQLIPHYKLGVNGYAFIINNNGFVVSHPAFRPWVEPCEDALCEIIREGEEDLRPGKPKPDYKNVDITYLEQEHNVSEGKITELRKRMIDGETGYIDAEVKKFYNSDLRRIYRQRQRYYFTKIPNTPYRLALVLIEPTDNQLIYTKSDLHNQGFKWCRLQVPDWKYCENEDSEKTPLQRFQAALSNYRNRSAGCDTELLRSLVHDAQVTEGIIINWDIYNWNNRPICGPGSQIQNCERKYEMMKQKHNRLEFNMVIVGTRSGLTRYQECLPTNDREDTDTQFCSLIDKYYEPIASMYAEYFRRALVTRKKIWVFDAKVPPSEDAQLNTSLISVTASKGVYIEKDEVNILSAVVGLNIKYDSFKNMFTNVTKMCRLQHSNCNETTCDNEDVHCYLLDENGFVVLSKNNDHVGKFFGHIDYQVLLDLGKEGGIFEKVVVTDYQALCKICNTSESSSNIASRLLDPFRYFYRILLWLLTKVTLFLLEFSLYDCWNCIYYATGQEQTSSTGGIRFDLAEGDDDDSSSINLRDPPPQLKDLLFTSPCYQNKTYYIDNYERATINGSLEGCYKCGFYSRSYVVTLVPNTNLYLLVLKGQCTCENEPQELCIESHELSNHGCSSSFLDRYRQPPNPTAHYKPDNNYQELEKLPCGQGCTKKLSLTISLLCIIIAHFTR